MSSESWVLNVLLIASSNQIALGMFKRHFFISLYSLMFSLGAIAAEPYIGDDSSMVKSVDIKYNSKINGFILNFPDHAEYKAVLYSNDSTWEFKLFHNQVLIESRKSEKVEGSNTKQAVSVIFRDIEKHNEVLGAFAEEIYR